MGGDADFLGVMSALKSLRLFQRLVGKIRQSVVRLRDFTLRLYQRFRPDGP